MAAAATGSLKICPQAVAGLFEVTMTEAGSYREDINSKNRLAAPASAAGQRTSSTMIQGGTLDLTQVGTEALVVMGGSQPHRPVPGAGELDPVSRQTRLDLQGNGQAGLAAARR